MVMQELAGTDPEIGRDRFLGDCNDWGCLRVGLRLSRSNERF